MTLGPQVTVVIPTFNGVKFLGQVLERLTQQVADPADFEVIVVDNNSDHDPLDSPEARSAIAKFVERNVRFRCVREPKQGLTFARSAGASAAEGPLLCFLDDDNLPCRTYICAGREFLRFNPAVGLLVSRVSPSFEVAPPPAIRRRMHLLAINEGLGDDTIRWPPGASCPSLGAGLWIRADLLNRIFASHAETMLSGRSGNRLTSGEDIEIGMLVGLMGYERAYLPELRIEHIIPKSRVADGYFAKLIEGVVRSELALEHRYGGRPLRVPQRYLKLIGCLTLGWTLAMRRGDAYREWRFMLAAARAACRGPFPTEKHPAPLSPEF